MATADARDYVLAFENNKPEAAQIAKRAAENLQNGQTNLLEVVKALGEYINDEDEKIRARAVNYLTTIISELPPKYLSRQQIQVLNQFLCSRIEDGGAIEGLSKLQALDRFTKEMVQDLMKAIFEHFSNLQDRPQSARYKVYSLVNELLSNHRKAVRDMGDESLVGIAQVVNGEKDPRNLMLIFSMMRVLTVEWDISKHIDLLFDSVYAYFPITFRPPPNDPYGITAQDLKDRLRDCLSSTGVLAPQVFPNMFDRLDSTSDAVKKDVLQALAACALNYDSGTINQYAITLWDTVKYEVLQAQEPFLADEALIVIKNIAICLSKDRGDHGPTEDPLVKYLKPIIKECLEHIQEPASRQANASGDILKAAASASVKSFEIILQGVGPSLFTLQQSFEGIVNQRAILTITNQLFEAAIEVYGTWTINSSLNNGGQENILVEFKEKLVAIYSRALMSTVKEEVSYRLAAAKGLLLLSQMRSLLADNEIGMFVQYFNDIVLDEESYGRDELKQRAMNALAEISKFKPQLITTITFPKFIARLPDSEDNAAQRKDYQSVLEGLAEISIGKELLETLIRRLLNKLDLLIETGTRTQYPYTCSILSTIYYVLDKNAGDEEITFDSYFDRVVVGLSAKAALAEAGPLANETVLNLLGRVVNLIIRRSSLGNKTQASGNIYLLFRDPITVSQTTGFAHDSIIPKPIHELFLSTWILAAIPRSLKIGIKQESPTYLIHDLSSFAGSCNDAAVQLACLQQIALLVNKHIAPGEELAYVDNFFSKTLTQSTSATIDQAQIEYCIRLAFTLARALILRLAPKTNEHLNSLVGLLQSPDSRISRFAALGFGTLLAKDEILSKTNDAQIRLLAPQRVFQTLVPIFASKFKEASGASVEQKETYLIALSGILGTVSSDIVMPELPTLLPLLLQSLDLVSDESNQSVKIASLETMVVVISNNPEALIESGHMSALVKRLLNTAALPGSSKQKATTKQQQAQVVEKQASKASTSPQARRLATRCLTLLPKFVKDKTPSPLLSLKREVLQGLGAVLDDPRRDVRKEAVDARAAWLRGVDDIESDEDE